MVTSPGSSFESTSWPRRCPADSFLWTRAAGVAETTARARPRSSRAGRLEEELSGLRLRISPDAFFQTNTEMAERLYGEAAELAGLSGREKVLDLFCGSARSRSSWRSTPARSGASRSSRRPWRTRSRTRARTGRQRHFFAGDVQLAMRPLLERSGQPDVVVVDPPRAGLSQKIVRRLLEAEAQKIVYVSCNPTTLAPNARQMVDAGYVLKTVRPVDMFPQTPHIECVALLERGSAPRPAAPRPSPRRPRLRAGAMRRVASPTRGRRGSRPPSAGAHSSQGRSIIGSTPRAPPSPSVVSSEITVAAAERVRSRGGATA